MQRAINIGTSATLFVLGIELKKIEFWAGLVAISRHSQCLSLASCENLVKLLFGPRSDLRVLAASDVATIQV